MLAQYGNILLFVVFGAGFAAADVGQDGARRHAPAGRALVLVLLDQVLDFLCVEDLGGSTQHLAAELFRSSTGLDFTIVPYKTSPDVVAALKAKDVQLVFEILSPLLPLH